MKVRVSLDWDALPLAAQTVNLDVLDVERFGRIDIRLDPDLDVVGHASPSFPIHESTWLRVRIELVDDAGRRMGRRILTP